MSYFLIGQQNSTYRNQKPIKFRCIKGDVQRADNHDHAYDIAVKMVREFYEPKKLRIVFNNEVCTTDEELREYFEENDMVCLYDMTSEDEPRPKIAVQVIAINQENK